MKALSLFSLLFLGCASTSLSPPGIVAPWPQGVTHHCPKRRIPLECFRKGGVEAAMETLLPRIQVCHRSVKDPLLINLTIETRAGVPTCVEHSRRNNERARCVAQVVAQHLRIPNSPDNEACDIRYPIRFN